MRIRQPRDALNLSCMSGASGEEMTNVVRLSICGRTPLKPSAHSVQ